MQPQNSDVAKYNSDALEPFVVHQYDQFGKENMEYCVIDRNVPFLTDAVVNGTSTKGRALTSRLYTGQQSDYELRTFNLFGMICGIQDMECADFIKENLVKAVQRKLPKETPPFYDPENMQQFNQEVRQAMIQAFGALDTTFKRKHPDAISSASLTVIVQYGWHIVCASVGDMRCLIDTGSGFAYLSKEHVLEDNPQEIQRALEAGVKIARLNKDKSGPSQDQDDGFGVLRMWNQSSQATTTTPDDDTPSGSQAPSETSQSEVYKGGFMVSRAIGGPAQDVTGLVCYPQLCHVELVKKAPARLVIVSRGCWEAWPNKSAKKNRFEGKYMVKFIRKRNTELATMGLVKRSVAFQGEKKRQHDVSAVMVDIASDQFLKFENAAKKSSTLGKNKSFCFGPPSTNEQLTTYVNYNQTLTSPSSHSNANHTLQTSGAETETSDNSSEDNNQATKNPSYDQMLDSKIRLYKYPEIKIHAYEDSLLTRQAKPQPSKIKGKFEDPLEENSQVNFQSKLNPSMIRLQETTVN